MSSLLDIIYQLRQVPRWDGSFQFEKEDVSQHSFSVIAISHILCELKETLEGKKINKEKLLLYALYHDVTEVVSTHIISPVKKNSILKDPFNAFREQIKNSLFDNLPITLSDTLSTILNNNDLEIQEIVEHADHVDAYCKSCIEVHRGNKDFISIQRSLGDKLDNLTKEYPYLKEFQNLFLKEFPLENKNYRYLN